MILSTSWYMVLPFASIVTPDTGAGDPTGLDTGPGFGEARPALRNREEQRAGQLGRLLNHDDPATRL